MITKRLAAALLLSGFSVAPASATLLLPSTTLIPITAFNIATQGSALAAKSFTGQSLTFAGTLRTAVYLNTLGTLDFYYQFARSGAGTLSNDAVETITGANFQNYLVDVSFSNADLDGDGIFTASNNPGLPATAQRNASGGVVGVDFAPSNPVAGNEISATYVFRTNATNYAPGTFGVIDGSTLQGTGFQPAAPVPETTTWAMFMIGFGAAGAALRNSRRVQREETC